MIADWPKEFIDSKGVCVGSPIRFHSVFISYSKPDEELAGLLHRELRAADVDAFFQDLSRAVPETGIVHYNTRLSKNFLTAADYRRIRSEVPNLIGTKFLGSLDELMDVVAGMPELVHFTHEETHAPARFVGGRGAQ